MSSRELILNRIKEGRPLRAMEYAAIPRAYRRNGTLSLEERVELLASRLRDYGCGVRECTEPKIAANIRSALRERGKQRVLVASDIPSRWQPEAYEWIRDEPLSYRELDELDGVITGCELAIAATGTIVLSHTRETLRRAATLIPDYHLCIVFAEQIVELVPEAFRKMASMIPAPLTTISGPSATSDIEMTRIQGVHGPRTLDVLIVR